MKIRGRDRDEGFRCIDPALGEQLPLQAAKLLEPADERRLQAHIAACHACADDQHVCLSVRLLGFAVHASAQGDGGLTSPAVVVALVVPGRAGGETYPRSTRVSAMPPASSQAHGPDCRSLSATRYLPFLGIFEAGVVGHAAARCKRRSVEGARRHGGARTRPEGASRRRSGGAGWLERPGDFQAGAGARRARGQREREITLGVPIVQHGPCGA